MKAPVKKGPKKTEVATMDAKILLNTLEREERTLKAFTNKHISYIRKSIDKIRHLDSVVSKMKSRRKKRRENNALTRKVLVEKTQSKVTANDLFIQGLKKVGRPAIVQEVADKLIRLRLPEYAELTKNKKKFKQMLYTGASNLSKNKEIKRHAINKNSNRFEYALKDWSWN